MNILINQLDNLTLNNKSYEFIPEDIKNKININGLIVGTHGKCLINQCDMMALLKSSELRSQIGENRYSAVFRKPLMVFVLPTQEEEFDCTKEVLNQRYGITTIQLNNFAQAFSLGCWLIKDSCVAAQNIYWTNLINGYNSQNIRDMPVTKSDGSISDIDLTEGEMTEAIDRMYEIYCYLLPEESKMGKVDHTCSSTGTITWHVDKAISNEGNSFARAFILLQEARRTGVLSSKVDKYCSVLECLYAINKEHKKNISDITAVYIGKDSDEQIRMKENMRDAYGIRSDASHGDSLKYLKQNDRENLICLVRNIDDYVRRVFRKVLTEKQLNYRNTSEEKARVRKYFCDLVRTEA